MFSGLSSLVIEDVTDQDGVIVVPGGGGGRAGAVPAMRRRDRPGARVLRAGSGGRAAGRAACPGAADTVPGPELPGADVPGAGPGLAGPLRRTTRLAIQVSRVARQLAGRAGAALLAALGIPLSRHTSLRALPRIPLPGGTVPRVLGVDDFALRRSQVYATILIDAETGNRAGVLPGRTADDVEAWLRDHPGVQIICRDGSGAYAAAARRPVPGAVQAGDRWHLRHGLAEAVLNEVAAHASCWAAAGPPVKEGTRAGTTAERWREVHDLPGKGTGLLECSRRLGLSPNTVKRYAPPSLSG